MQAYSNLINLVFCSSILAACFISWLNYISPIKKTRNKIKKIILMLKKLPGQPEESEITNETFKKCFPDDDDLKKIFEEFINERELNLYQYEGKKYSTIRIEHYFNIEVISARLLNIRMITAIPGIMTGLGILGTFFGLVLGISSIRITESKILINDIQSLLSGMNIAFSTSIVGIILALLWIIAEKHQYKNLSKSIDDFNKCFENIFIYKDLNLLMVKGILSHLNNIDLIPQKLDLLHVDMCNISGNMLKMNEKYGEKIFSSISSSFRDEFIPEFKKVVENSIESSSKALELVCGFRSTMDVLNSDMKEISKNHKNIISSLKEESREITKMIKESFDLTSKFRKFSQEISLYNGKISDNFQSFSSKIDALSSSINESAAKFETNITSFRLSIDEKKALVDLNIDKINEGFTTLNNALSSSVIEINKVPDNIGRMLKNIIDDSDKIMGAKVGDIGKIVKEMNGNIQTVSNKMITIVNRLIGNLDILPKRVAETVANRINMVMDTNKLSESVKTISDELTLRFIGIKDMLKNSVDSLGESFGNLSDIFDSYSKQIGSLPENLGGVISDRVRAVFDNSANFKAFEGLNSSLETFNANFTKNIDSAAGKIGNSMINGIKDFETSLSDLNNIFGEFHHSISGVETNLKQVSEIMRSSSELLGENLNSSFTKTFISFDEQLSKITMHLSGTISEIESAVKDIPNVISQLDAAIKSRTDQIK